MDPEELSASRERECGPIHAERGRTIRLLRGALLVAGIITGGKDRRTQLRQLWLGIRIALHPDALRTWRRHFDAGWYLARNPDVLAAGQPAALHYLLKGFLEGRVVSQEDGSRGYLRDYPDVAAAGVNPLAHYALAGRGEGRAWPHPVPPTPPAASCEGSPQPAADRAEIRLNTVWPAELPLVSVVIPCFNYGGQLRESLETVLLQTWEDVEVIVVEGGSTDPASLAAVRGLEAAAPPRTSFLYRSERHLAGGNRNFGIGHARGRYVCCLDADDLLEFIYLEVAIFLAERFGYDLVYPSVRCFGASDEVWPIANARFPEIARENAVSTVALFKRSAWAEVGGYRDWGLGDQHVPEDWEFWTRVLGHGCRVMGIRAPLLNYRVHAAGLTQTSTSSAKFQAEQILEANRSLIEHGRPARAIAASLEIQDGFCNILAPRRFSARTDAVLFALPFITVGGAEQLLTTLGKELVDRGRRLIITTSDALPGTMPSVPEIFRMITPHVYDLVELFSNGEHRNEFVRYLVERYQVNTLLLVGSRFVYSLLPALRAHRPRMAVVDQLFNDVGHLEANRYYREEIDLTIVPSEALRDVLVSGHGEDPTRVVTIPHGIALPESVAAAMANLPADWLPEVPIVAFFGRMSEEKGPQLFVRIARELSRDAAVNFMMTGEGPLWDEVRSLIRDAGLEDRFFTPGFVADVRPLMRRADLVVIPSLVDGLPLVALESLAWGKPVVASAVGSLPAVVRDGETGFLCSPGNVAAFSQRISELLADPALRCRLGETGRRLIRSEYGSDRMTASYLRAFDVALDTASRR